MGRTSAKSQSSWALDVIYLSDKQFMLRLQKLKQNKQNPNKNAQKTWKTNTQFVLHKCSD